MNAKTQIIVLLFSYLYGFLAYYLIKLNKLIIQNKKPLFQSIITILLMYNLTLIYIINLYKLNEGITHIYFFICILLGFFTNLKVSNKLKKNVKYQNFLAKLKKKCYTNTSRK